MIRCIAIDDEPLALKLLARYCEQVPSIKLLATYTDSVEALAYIRTLKPDLVFLDIQMPDLSGIEIANVLEENTLVIFTTAHKEYAVEGFELNIVDYLLKPFDFDRFMKAYSKAEERYSAISAKTQVAPSIEKENPDEEVIVVKYNYHNMTLPVHSILYIEACNNNIKIVTKENTYTPVMTMKYIWELLPKSKFVRVHKSYILPLDKIKSFNREKVTTDAIQVPVGRAYYKEFFKRMNLNK